MKLNEMIVYFMLFGKTNAPGLLNNTFICREFSITQHSLGKDFVIKELADVVKITKDFTQRSCGLNRIYFRGESNINYSPVPGIFRKPLMYDELNMANEFKAQYCLHGIEPKNTFDWLCLMQHYSIPTRVLDWSESCYVGLFFCCNKAQEEMEMRKKYSKNLGSQSVAANEFGGLYALDSKKLNEAAQFVSQKYQKNYHGIYYYNDWEVKLRTAFFEHQELKEFSAKIQQKAKKAIDGKFLQKNKQQLLTPIAVYPKRAITPRMNMQKGIFTLHGGWNLPDTEKDFMPINLEDLNNQLPDEEKFLMKFPVQNRLYLRDQLAHIGYHVGSLYLDWDSVGKYLREKFAINNKQISPTS